jgi:hypothetical protein
MEENFRTRTNKGPLRHLADFNNFCHPLTTFVSFYFLLFTGDTHRVVGFRVFDV